MERNSLYPVEVLRWALEHDLSNQIKSVSSPIPFHPDLQLHDISATFRGGKQQIVFSKNHKIRQNIRRGNTLLVKFKPAAQASQNQDTIKVKGKKMAIEECGWIRRGMHKFFDIRIQGLRQQSTIGLAEQGSFSGNFKKIYTGENSYKEIQRRLIFLQAEKAIINGAAVQIYQTNKANGEHAQIAYSSILDAWIIASKNVSMAVRHPDDISLYTFQRYKFASLIAETWFGLISNLSQEETQNLKKDVQGLTMIGEYVGNSEYQHLVRYSDITILFYGIVDNLSQDTCIPPLKSYYIFKKYRLPAVKAEKIGSFIQVDEFYRRLNSLFEEVAASSIHTGEEGSVLYIVRSVNIDNQLLLQAQEAVFGSTPLGVLEEEVLQATSCQTTLSLGKLKTIEYRILRKLREKLKNTKSGNIQKQIQRFRCQLKELIGNTEVPQEFEYYMKIATTAFGLIKKNLSIGGSIQDKYLDFIDKVVSIVNSNEIPVWQEFKDQKSFVEAAPMSIVLMVPPLYFTQEQILFISDNLNCSSIQYKWQEKTVIGNKPLCIVQRNIKFSQNFKRNAFIVFAGYTQNGKHISISRLKQLKIMKNLSKKKISQDISQCLNTKNFQSRIYTQFIQIQKNIEFLGLKYPKYCFNAQDRSCQEIIQAVNENLRSINQIQLPIEQSKQQAKTFAPKVTYVIKGLGIPCMGKTRLIERCRQKLPSDWEFVVISSDDIRWRCMQRFMKNKKQTTRDFAFDKTGKIARQEYFAQIRRKLNSESRIQVLFLDKNHPTNSIQASFKEFNSMNRIHRKLKFILLVPDTSVSYIYQRPYPFSMSLLLQCLMRLKMREEHQTLVGSFAKRIAVALMMFNLYSGSKVERIEPEFDYKIEIPFVDEQIQPEEFFVQQVGNILSNHKIRIEPSEDSVRDLQQYLLQLDINPKPIDPSSEFISKLLQIIQIDQTQFEPYQKIQQGKPERPFTKKNPPVYLGISVNQQFYNQLLPYIISSLQELSEIFPEFPTQDLNELQQCSISEFSPKGFVSLNWHFTNSLHVTSLFIGNDRRKLQTHFYKEFKLNVPCQIMLKHFVYVPGGLMCASVEVLGGPDIENAIPHLTLLCSSLPPKASNDILGQLKLGPKSSVQRVFVRKKQNQAFVMKLKQSLVLKGVTQEFN